MKILKSFSNNSLRVFLVPMAGTTIIKSVLCNVNNNALKDDIAIDGLAYDCNYLGYNGEYNSYAISTTNGRTYYIKEYEGKGLIADGYSEDKPNNTFAFVLGDNFTKKDIRTLRNKNGLKDKTLHFYMDLTKNLFYCSPSKQNGVKLQYLSSTKDDVSRWDFKAEMAFHTISHYANKYGKKTAEKVYANGWYIESENPHFKCSDPMRLMAEKVFEYNLKMID